MATATRRRRPAADADEYEEETPRRRRRPEPEDTDEDVEEAPRRRRAKPQDDEEEEEKPRRRRASRDYDDDEDGGDEDGRPRRRREAARPGRRVARGWDGYEETRAKSSDFEDKYKPTSKASVVALLEEDGPFASFARHWVDLEGGKRAFICPASLDYADDEDKPECPLCDIGDKPNAPKAYLNVAIMAPGRKPKVAVWEIGPAISDQLQIIDKSLGRKTSLTDVYIEASSKGTGINTKYFLEPLFEDDLNDLGIKPLTDEQRDSLELYDESIYQIPTVKELDRVADELV